MSGLLSEPWATFYALPIEWRKTQIVGPICIPQCPSCKVSFRLQFEADANEVITRIWCPPCGTEWRRPLDQKRI